MKTVISVIASEAGYVLGELRTNVNPERAAELFELLALHEQLTGTIPPNITEAQITRISHINLGLDDEVLWDEALLATKGIQDGDHPHPAESNEAA